MTEKDIGGSNIQQDTMGLLTSMGSTDASLKRSETSAGTNKDTACVLQAVLKSVSLAAQKQVLFFRQRTSIARVK